MIRKVRLIIPPWAPVEIPAKLRAIALEDYTQTQDGPLKAEPNQNPTLPLLKDESSESCLVSLCL